MPTAKKTANPAVKANPAANLEQTEQPGEAVPLIEVLTLADCETLSKRIETFHQCYSAGRIALELIEKESQFAAVAIVYTGPNDDEYKASGYGYVASSVPNADMIAQDLAIGRALANAGVYSGERHTQEERAFTNAARLIAAVNAHTPATPLLRAEMTPRQARASEALKERERAQERQANETLPPPVPDLSADPDADALPPNALLTCVQCGVTLQPQVYAASLKNFGVALCVGHQREARNPS